MDVTKTTSNLAYETQHFGFHPRIFLDKSKFSKKNYKFKNTVYCLKHFKYNLSFKNF